MKDPANYIIIITGQRRAGKTFLLYNKIQCFIKEGTDPEEIRLVDPGYRVFITGSNASMLGKEMATTLGGRFLVKEIDTLLFQSNWYSMNGSRSGDFRNTFALRLIIKKLAEGTADEISYNRIRNILQSAGIRVGTATVIEYINYLEDSFLIRSLKNFRYQKE